MPPHRLTSGAVPRPRGSPTRIDLWHQIELPNWGANGPDHGGMKRGEQGALGKENGRTAYEFIRIVNPNTDEISVHRLWLDQPDSADGESWRLRAGPSGGTATPLNQIACNELP